MFGLDPDGYDQSRFGYPDELFAELRSHLGPYLGALGEIGPGTGLATRRLLEFEPDRFVAFEPDARLAAYLHKRFPSIEIAQQDFLSVDMSPDFDLIAAAASFHWLDPSLALSHVRKLLKPGGLMALWWNVYTEALEGSLAAAVAPLVSALPMPPSIPAQGHYSLNESLHRSRIESAGFGFIGHRLFVTEIAVSPDRARGLYASFSFVRILDPESRKRLLEAIAQTVVERFGDSAPLRILTPLYLARSPG